MKLNGANTIFSIRTEKDFLSEALRTFQHQSEHNKVYKSYISHLDINVDSVAKLKDIPFLPISLFKSCDIKSGDFEPEITFLSSGTGGPDRSKHPVRDLDIYRESFTRSFREFYGDPEDISIFALLPSYLENSDSSLIYMTDKLISLNARGRGGFFLNNYAELLSAISSALTDGDRVILLGVTYALLDLAEKVSPDLSNVTVMETGGMKGRRKEMLREEVHEILKINLKVDTVHSEYGMTELLSQAWSKGSGIFQTPSWMKVLIRDPLNPGSFLEPERTGGLNIIDLANIHSCSFIETSDLGRLVDGGFEVSGRFDNSDIRGCNLLIH